MDTDLEIFGNHLSRESREQANQGLKGFNESLACAYSTVAEAKFLEIVSGNHKVEKLQKMIEAELTKIGRNSKAWGRNIKALLHKAARDEMDGIILSA